LSELTRPALRIWFCLGVATIAAAIADPLVEFASNAHWFGPGRFTDRSNLDVLPALIAGVLLVAAYFALKIRSGLAHAGTAPNLFREFDRACSPELTSLLPTAFALQILTLFTMESAEQLTIWGHLGGPTLWLGGPPAISLLVHAVTCVLVAFAAMKFASVMGATTVRVLRFIRSLSALTPIAPRPSKLLLDIVIFAQFILADIGIGERAPPIFQA